MGLGDAWDSVTGAVEDGTEAVGDGVEWAGDKAADGLDAVGWESGAEGVRDGTEWAADKLGADVAERQLGETEEPKEIVHGDVAKIQERVEHLRDFAKAFEKLGSGLKALHIGGWKGKAADGFMAAFEPQPRQWLQLADACEDARRALDVTGRR